MRGVALLTALAALAALLAPAAQGSATGGRRPTAATCESLRPHRWAPATGTTDRPGVLMGFIEAADGRHALVLSRELRRQLVVDSFVRYFGPKASKPVAYVEKSWADEEWTRGCYAGFFPPGVWTDYGEVLRRPIGRIHWAGTETATVWNGYMDGAVRSGERAAAEVARHLS